MGSEVNGTKNLLKLFIAYTKTAVKTNNLIGVCFCKYSVTK